MRKRQREKRHEDCGSERTLLIADKLAYCNRSDLFCPERGVVTSFAMIL